MKQFSIVHVIVLILRKNKSNFILHLENISNVNFIKFTSINKKMCLQYEVKITKLYFASYKIFM